MAKRPTCICLFLSMLEQLTILCCEKDSAKAVEWLQGFTVTRLCLSLGQSRKRIGHKRPNPIAGANLRLFNKRIARFALVCIWLTPSKRLQAEGSKVAGLQGCAFFLAGVGIFRKVTPGYLFCFPRCDLELAHNPATLQPCNPQLTRISSSFPSINRYSVSW